MGEVLVNIEQGSLKGKSAVDCKGRKYIAFLGIPYAKPPIGKLRFKAPQPPEKWTDVRDATKDGNSCYSREPIFKNVAGSEDCLFLNVFTPELPNEKCDNLKPVMVWIHGGGFNSGSNKTNIYGPDYLIAEDVIIVSINYRLGVLGFLSVQDPDLGVPGNAAMKDMVMSLKWVQGNIKAFGGDPNNVTLFGQSAGGLSVHLLVLSQMTKGLIHKAIVQSGCALNPWSLGTRFVENLANAANCPYENEKDILNYLEDLPIDKLFEAQEEMLKDRTNRLGPVLENLANNEDIFLETHPSEIILKGDYNHVPILMGYTSNEGMFFLTKPGEVNIVDFEKYVPHYLNLEKGSSLSLEIAEKIKNFYYGEQESTGEDVEKACRLLTDSQFSRDTQRSMNNHALSSTSPLYLYRFSLDAKLNLYKVFARLELPGASHGDDLGYLFKTMISPALVAGTVEANTVQRMSKIWTDFAKTGNPNPLGDLKWKPVVNNELNYLNIGEELTTGINPDIDRIRFWNEVEKIYQNDD